MRTLSRTLRLAEFTVMGALGLLPALATAQTATSPAVTGSSAVSGLPSLRLFEIARRLELDGPEPDAMAVLISAGGLHVEAAQPLPNGMSRVVIAVPEDDDCLPRAASMVCSAIRVVFTSDPMRGGRVSRIEAFERLPGRSSVTEIFRTVALGLGPPLQTESWAEQIRGMPRNVWRRRWRPDTREGVFLEVMATSESEADEVPGLADPSGPAMGVGFVLVDKDIEESTLMASGRFACHGGELGCR
ncbi:hypothetical protein [Roseococcus pinisoli]|uniref:Uncharacterized protein n=1 Tax=Roseococcus pinisoli TaxID=2835040 RepID=A0ABS5QDJ4_9PROT|nr:hypothetical protein [Roseococcus pinisoli]MBS7811331.1 hypothetical protein [Roseococcus pinisoli]